MKQVLNVSGMSCEHCAGRVEEAVSALAGVNKVKVKLKKNEVKVNFDDTLQSIDTISTTINELGYQVEN
ncbi:copper ion binding protein [Vagococcus silagei]|uniref:Copper chaperone CopZ n=1 Tax=Vagococcus silagei TaxID=2508885 RepID=A0A4S3B708_9ENTE|nr:copper ion binding protein [Vagococcus silagei]THB60455.1 copper chaperone [Vagococcus silagei]